MNGLISKNALIEALKEDKKSLFSQVFCYVAPKMQFDVMNNLERLINKQPTVEPVCGEWKVKTKSNNGYTVSITCSSCGYSHARVMYNFCPECGADMRKGGVNNV